MSTTRVVILTAAFTVAVLAALFGLAVELGEWFMYRIHSR